MDNLFVNFYFLGGGGGGMENKEGEKRRGHRLLRRGEDGRGRKEERTRVITDT